MGRAVNRSYTAWLAWAPGVGFELFYTAPTLSLKGARMFPPPTFDPTWLARDGGRGAWRHTTSEGTPGGPVFVVARLGLCIDGLSDATGIPVATLRRRDPWVRRITGVNLEGETPMDVNTAAPPREVFRHLGQEGHPATPPFQEGRAGEHYRIVQELPGRLGNIEAAVQTIRDDVSEMLVHQRRVTVESTARRTRPRRPARAKSAKGSGKRAARPGGRSRPRGRT